MENGNFNFNMENFMPVDITAENFEQEIMESQIPVLAYFHLPNCAKCSVFSSVGEGLEKRNAGKFKLAKFNIMQNQKLARELGASSAPSYIVWLIAD
jgi:thioredoxin-like negative regulator of GroEL